MRRRRAATDAELALWRHAMRDATPLRLDPITPVVAADSAPPPPPPPQVAAAPPPRRPQGRVPADPPPPPPPPHKPRSLIPGGAHDLDGGGAERLRRGDWPIEGRIDLHGMTQRQAHDALYRFLHIAQAQGKRCVLVITGKGTAGEGILRAQVPRWINEPPTRGRVLALAPAQPRHGGLGALYVLLKKNR